MADITARIALTDWDTATSVAEKLHDNGDGTYTRTVYDLAPAGGGGGGAVTIADGANVAQGSTTDAANANSVVGQLKQIKTNTATATGMVDAAAWTAATSTFSPAGGVFHDSAAALTSGQQGTARLTPNRGQHANLRNQAGTELGTTANPLQTGIAQGGVAAIVNSDGSLLVRQGNLSAALDTVTVTGTDLSATAANTAGLGAPADDINLTTVVGLLKKQQSLTLHNSTRTLGKVYNRHRVQIVRLGAFNVATVGVGAANVTFSPAYDFSDYVEMLLLVVGYNVTLGSGAGFTIQAYSKEPLVTTDDLWMPLGSATAVTLTATTASHAVALVTVPLTNFGDLVKIGCYCTTVATSGTLFVTAKVKA